MAKLTSRFPDAERHFLIGNHEERIERAQQDMASFTGAIGYKDLALDGWKVHGFLDVAWIDGVAYSHFFANNKSGRPLGGMVPSRLKTLGHSFVQGHQQGLEVGTWTTLQGMRWGIVAGSCYLHEEGYRAQGADQNCWHGVVLLHEVRDGIFDPMFVSLDFLCRRYEKMSLASFRARYL